MTSKLFLNIIFLYLGTESTPGFESRGGVLLVADQGRGVVSGTPDSVAHSHHAQGCVASIQQGFY